MSVSIPDFWKLLLDSRLLSSQQCQLLGREFDATKGAAQGNAKSLSQFLQTKRLLTRYQSTVLLAGRSGPFFYGDYKVHDRIDQGRLAGLFRAVHVETNHPVLLQFFTGPVTQDPRMWAAVQSQARLHCGVAHAHLQRWHETIDLSTFKFLVGEDLSGESLEQRLAAGPLPLAEACRVVRAAALGLVQLHEARLVHGDLRPRNLWLEPSGNVKVLRDPASIPAPLHQLPADQAKELPARADYLAPELAQQGKSPDALTDIYALGCTLYQLLSGRVPFVGGDVNQKLGRHAAERIASLEEVGVPPQVAQVVAYLMAKNAGVRFQNASLVADRLASFVDPAHLYAAPPLPAATLRAFEASLAQKQPDGGGPVGDSLPPEPGQGAFPTLEKRRKRPSPAVSFGPQIGGTPVSEIDVEGFAGISTSPPVAPPAVAVETQPAAPLVDIATAGAPLTVKATRPALKPKKSIFEGGLSNPNTRFAAIAAGLVAVLAIGAVVGFSMLGGKGKPDPDKVVAANPSPDQKETTEKKPPPKQPVKPNETPVVVTEGPAVGPAVDVPLVQQVVPDDGNLLWASPTSGPPVNTAGLPLGVQVIIAARPAEMLAGGEGGRVLAALGPTFAAWRSSWEAAAGVKLEEVEELLVGLSEGEDGSPRTAVVVRLKTPLAEGELLSRWQNPSPAEGEGGVSYTSRGWSFHIPPSGEGKMFVMGSPGEIKEVMELKAGPPPMRREVERLRGMSDSKRHFTALVHPNFLFNEQGQKMFSGDQEKIRHALAWFLGEGLQGGLVSMHFGKEAYAEVRLIAKSDKPRYGLAEDFRNRLEQVPRLVESYIDELDPPAYWKPVARRFPLAIGFLHKYTRVGVEEEQAVINAVLPGHAAHNLIAAGELAIISTPGKTGRVVTNVSEPPKPEGPKSLEGVLAAKTSMKFDQESLEFAMQKVAADVKESFPGLPLEFKVVLMGNDMKLDGITKNQSIRDFNEQDKTVAEILTAMVRKANPITTVKDPSELDQKLIWVIGPDPDAPDKQCILVTTRAAAQANKYTLPAPFAPKAGK